MLCGSSRILPQDIVVTGGGVPGRRKQIRFQEFSDLNETGEKLYVGSVLYVRYVLNVLYVLFVFYVLCIFCTERTMMSFPVKPEPDHDHPIPGHRPPH